MRGSAFLALWNDCDPVRSDYNSWHTREHVPERLALPGFMSAHRYASSAGGGEFFTLYQLTDMSVLLSQAYGDLLSSPTPWSRSMRGNMQRFDRRAYFVAASLGAGVGAFIAVAHLARLQEGADVGQLAAEIAKLAAVTAVHIGKVDASLPEVPFAQSAQSDGPDADWLLIVEGYDETELRSSFAAIDRLIDEQPSISQTRDWATYRLAFALDESARLDVVPLTPPDEILRDAKIGDGSDSQQSLDQDVALLGARLRVADAGRPPDI